jgi:signal peptidase I
VIPKADTVTKRPALGCLLEVVETLVLTIVIFFAIQTFVAQPFKVEGGSMEATLLDGHYVLIDKLTPRWAPYGRGDIVVLEQPGPGSPTGAPPFIKRVIGLPGDHVELIDGIVHVNGVPLDEPYIYTADGVPQTTDETPGGPREWHVPVGRLFVLGDHRWDSSDSRAFGPIETSKVLGRAWLRYWPLDAFGTLPAADPRASPFP